MKNAVLAPLAALLLVLAASHGFGQNVTLDTGFMEQTVSSVDAVVGGFDMDTSGNLYYFGAPEDNTSDSQIIEETAASDYQSATTIVDYGTATFSNFLKYHDSALYYGDSAGNFGNVNSTTLPVSSPVSPTVIANMPGNYDFAFSGATPFVSADITGAATFAADNEVDELDLATGNYKKILGTADNSGPIAFDASGDLLYGASGFTGIGGIYLFTAAQVSNAFTSGTALRLSDGNEIINNTGNSGFALVGDELYQSFNSLIGGQSTLTLYNLSTFTSTQIGLGDPGDFFSEIESYNGNLVVAETDFSTTTNFIEIEQVPEPGAVWLGTVGITILLLRRRGHAKA
jgi:hypothetical protein